MIEPVKLEEYKRAYKEIIMEGERRGFLIHLIVYLFINAMFVTVNFLYTPGNIWFFYPVLIWGIGITLHYLGSIKWIEKNMEEKEAKAEYRARDIKNRSY